MSIFDVFLKKKKDDTGEYFIQSAEKYKQAMQGPAGSQANMQARAMKHENMIFSSQEPGEQFIFSEKEEYLPKANPVLDSSETAAKTEAAGENAPMPKEHAKNEKIEKLVENIFHHKSSSEKHGEIEILTRMVSDLVESMAQIKNDVDAIKKQVSAENGNSLKAICQKMDDYYISLEESIVNIEDESTKKAVSEMTPAGVGTATQTGEPESKDEMFCQFVLEVIKILTKAKVKPYTKNLVSEICSKGNICSPRTLFREIRKLEKNGTIKGVKDGRRRFYVICDKKPENEQKPVTDAKNSAETPELKGADQ